MRAFQRCAICKQKFRPTHSKPVATCGHTSCKCAYVKQKVKERMKRTMKPCAWEGCRIHVDPSKRKGPHKYCYRHSGEKPPGPPRGPQKKKEIEQLHKLMMLTSDRPRQCPKCQGCVVDQYGPLSSDWDVGYEDTYRCLECGFNGHMSPERATGQVANPQLRATVQAMALNLFN